MKPFTDDEVAVQRANLATFCDRDSYSLNFVATARDIERRWLATLDASRSRALEWFDRWVEAVRQATAYTTSMGGDWYSHAFLTTWQDAWEALGLASVKVSRADFDKAVARARAGMKGGA